MSEKLDLYFFPGSYYSMKVLYALYEKGIPFNEHKINIHNGDEASDWFLNINPHGEVPCLKDGERTVIESEDIVDYIDKKYPDASPHLVPDEGTALGQEVREMRNRLHAVHIDWITYGVMVHRHFCVGVDQPRWPAFVMRRFTKDSLTKYFEKGLARLRSDIVKRPQYKDLLTRKLKIWEERGASAFDEVKLSGVLNGLDTTFDDIEQRLVKSGAVAGKEAEGDLWMFAQFTAADITAAILLTRLYDLGVDERFFSPTKRPVVFAYYTRLMALPSTAKVSAMKLTVGLLYMKTAFRDFCSTFSPYGLAFGLVVGGAIAYYRYRH